jgi:4'-phosphopantetheinyl transferase
MIFKMGLCKYWHIDNEITVGFWQIIEPVEDLEALYRKNDSEPDYETMHHPQKKREWLASRLLLRLMLKDQGIDNFTVLKTASGKPFLLDSVFQISFTNTNKYVAVALSKQKNIGIDLELPSEKLNRVAHKFLSQKEFITAQNDVEILCSYWAAKEAVYKHYGKKGISFAKQIAVSTNTAYLFLEKETVDYKLFKNKIEDYLCVVCVETNKT